MNKNIIIIILLLIAVGGGYFLYTNESNEPIVQNQTPTPIPNPPTPTPTPPPPAPTPVPPNTELKPEIVWGDRTKKQVILTFDGGAGIQSADKILNALKAQNVVGTFFLTGKWAEQNPEIIKRISREGHEIFNHTYSHPDLTTISDAKIREEFSKTETIIKNLTGVTTKPYFRPPYGARNLHVREVLAEEGYQSIYWTVDALDWKEDQGFTAQQTKDKIFANLKPGTIYMMHIGDNITGNILDEVITRIRSEGYSIVSLTQGL